MCISPCIIWLIHNVLYVCVSEQRWYYFATNFGVFQLDLKWCSQQHTIKEHFQWNPALYWTDDALNCEEVDIDTPFPGCRRTTVQSTAFTAFMVAYSGSKMSWTMVDNVNSVTALTLTPICWRIRPKLVPNSSQKILVNKPVTCATTSFSITWYGSVSRQRSERMIVM